MEAFLAQRFGDNFGIRPRRRHYLPILSAGWLSGCCRADGRTHWSWRGSRRWGRLGFRFLNAHRRRFGRRGSWRRLSGRGLNRFGRLADAWTRGPGEGWRHCLSWRRSCCHRRRDWSRPTYRNRHPAWAFRCGRPRWRATSYGPRCTHREEHSQQDHDNQKHADQLAVSEY